MIKVLLIPLNNKYINLQVFVFNNLVIDYCFNKDSISKEIVLDRYINND